MKKALQLEIDRLKREVEILKKHIIQQSHEINKLKLKEEQLQIVINKLQLFEEDYEYKLYHHQTH